jgi:hypothetical protein
MQLTLVTKADVVVSFVSENLSLGTFLAAAFRHGDRAQTLKLRCRDVRYRVSSSHLASVRIAQDSCGPPVGEFLCLRDGSTNLLPNEHAR